MYGQHRLQVRTSGTGNAVSTELIASAQGVRIQKVKLTFRGGTAPLFARLRLFVRSPGGPTDHEIYDLVCPVNETEIEYDIEGARNDRQTPAFRDAANTTENVLQNYPIRFTIDTADNTGEWAHTVDFQRREGSG